MKYYDIPKHWTKRIDPHIESVRCILTRDFNKFTWGRWRKKFTDQDVPHGFDSCDWRWRHKGRHPRYWDYVCHSACHWLVNFNLRLAQLVEPKREWRILTSQEHSTVWDGAETLFDFNFLALGVPADEAFQLANEKHLPVGKELKVYFAEHYSVERRAA